MEKRIQDAIEDGTVVSAHDTCMSVETEDGVELYIGARTVSTGCSCCGDSTELIVSYNRLTEHRIETHGDADPLNIL